MRIHTNILEALTLLLFVGHVCAETEGLYGPCAGSPQAVEEVASGARTVASAAWWGFDCEDATECLQHAIDSGAKTVVVPYMGAPWIVRPITLRSNQEIVFDPGVVVLAKRGEFKGKGDSLFGADGQNDIVLRGYGATLRMWKEDYQSAAYDKAEWRMTLDFVGCRRIHVEGLRLENSGGDGIYLGATTAQPWCEDVVIRDVVCDGHHRQGMSVISAVNLLVENCAFTNTSGTAPEAGIDFEPNKPNEKLVNCVVRNCIFENNDGAGVLVYVKPLSKESEPLSILVENCHVRSGRDQGIGIGAVRDDGPGGTIEFRNCTIEKTQEGGVYVYDKSADRAQVRFVNCKWSDVGLGDSAGAKTRAPLQIGLRRPELVQKLGGIEFVDCCLFDSVDRPALVVESKQNELGVYDITGTISVHSPFAPRADIQPAPHNVTLNVVSLPGAPGNRSIRGDGVE